MSTNHNMLEEITQENLYLILPLKISILADMLMEDENIDVVEAIKRISSSATYKRLERESSKAWTLGPTTLCYDLTHETNNSAES